MGKMPAHLLLHNRILVRKHWLTVWKQLSERDMTCLIDGSLVKLHATPVSFEPGRKIATAMEVVIASATRVPCGGSALGTRL